MPAAGFPLPVVWDQGAGSDPHPRFVDEAIKHFAEHGRPKAHDRIEVVEADDPDEQGMILLAVDPYKPTERFRAFLTIGVDSSRGLAVVVWRIEPAEADE